MNEMYVNVAGEQRRVVGVYSNIDGEWRESTVSSNICGTWKQSVDVNISADNIVGFRFIYTLNRDAKYPDLPNLKYNPRLPVRISISDTEMNMNSKGILFQYENTLEPDQLLDDEEEGILMYVGRLYAVTDIGLLIDVSDISGISGYSGRKPIASIPGVSEVWNFNKFNDLSIVIDGKVSYYIYGLNTEGWNKMFDTTNYIGNLNRDRTEDFSDIAVESCSVLPLDSRSNNFYSCAEIGIARDLHTAGRNMIGSHGYLAQNIVRITVNGVKKPFTCEIYD